MRSYGVAFTFALSLATAASISSRWLEISGGTWHPAPALLGDVEASLKAALPVAANGRGRLPEWGSYTFQYQGQSTFARGRLIVVNAFCDDPNHHPDRLKAWVTVFDGGACFFSAKYDLASKRLYDLVVNGVG